MKKLLLHQDVTEADRWALIAEAKAAWGEQAAKELAESMGMVMGDEPA